MFCSVETVIEVFNCVKTGVIKSLLVFVFSANSVVSINGSDVSFAATNCVIVFFFTN